jgi:hypothetical protein
MKDQQILTKLEKLEKELLKIKKEPSLNFLKNNLFKRNLKRIKN